MEAEVIVDFPFASLASFCPFDPAIYLSVTKHLLYAVGRDGCEPLPRELRHHDKKTYEGKMVMAGRALTMAQLTLQSHGVLQAACFNGNPNNLLSASLWQLDIRAQRRFKAPLCTNTRHRQKRAVPAWALKAGVAFVTRP